MKEHLPQNWLNLLASWSEELNSTTDRIHYLIGNQHQPTKGNYREVLVRKLLRRILPEKFRVSTGFIYRWHNNPSKQLDVIIWDALNGSALLEEGELVVVTEDVVAAIIEVKSTLNASELQKSLDLLQPEWAKYWNRSSEDSKSGLKQNFPSSRPPFRAIFAFRTTIKTKVIFTVLANFYRQRFGQDAQEAVSLVGDKLQYVNIIDAVCCMNKVIIEQGSLGIFRKSKDGFLRTPGLAAIKSHDSNQDIVVGRFCMNLLKSLTGSAESEAARYTTNALPPLDKPGICTFGAMPSEFDDAKWWGTSIDKNLIWSPQPPLY